MYKFSSNKRLRTQKNYQGLPLVSKQINEHVLKGVERLIDRKTRRYKASLMLV